MDAVKTLTVPPEEERLLARVRDVVCSLEPAARLILFGSRARGGAALDSDWDLLVLVDGPVDSRRREAISGRLGSLALETDTVLQSLVVSKDDWDAPRYRVTPLYANVADDGIELTPAATNVAEPKAVSEEQMAQAREDLVREWIRRAHETLTEAEDMASLEHWNGCVNRIYYACFDAVRSLLLQRGYRFSKHSSVQSLLNRDFGKTGVAPAEFVSLYNVLFEQRTDADYEPYIRFTEAEVRPWLTQARQFIAFIEELLKSSPS